MTMFFVLALAMYSVHVVPAVNEEMLNLGTVAVGEYKGQVLFQYPADDGECYRIDVAISKPNDTDAINSGRLEVWLLARGGTSAKLRERPRPGAIIEVNSAGTTADAIFFFDRDVERQHLVGVVVFVDGELTALKIPQPK